MIISRPKGSTLVSFILFSAVTLVVLILNILVAIQQKNPPWYTFLIIGLLLPILGFVIYRIFIRYKVLKFGNNQVEIFFPVMRRRQVYKLSDVNYWTEHKVKTGKTGAYKELEVRFNDKRKMSMGFQEYSEYGKVLGYLQLKLAKKRK